VSLADVTVDDEPAAETRFLLGVVATPFTERLQYPPAPLPSFMTNTIRIDLQATGSVIVQAVVADVLTSLIIVAPPPGAINFTPAGQVPEAFGPCRFQFRVSM
jgi:hypothetical protein